RATWSLGRSCAARPRPCGARWLSLACRAPLLAVCRASILVETPGDVASCSSPSRGKRRVFERCKPVFLDQLRLSTHAETLSDALLPRCQRCYITAVTGSQEPP